MDELGVKQVIGGLLLAFFVTLTQMCGMGGGPVITILLQLFFQLDTKSAVKYTYILLLGGSLASTAINVPRKDAQGFPLINYQLVMMTLPTIVAGSVIGVYFNNLLPEAIILLLMFVFLSFTCLKTYRKITNQKTGAST